MKKIFYMVLSLGLIIVLFGISTVLILKTNDLSEMELKYENSLRASLQEATHDMRNLENDLSKLMITTNESVRVQLLSTVALKSSACGQELSKLPIVATGVQNTLKFTNQLSSYCTTVLNSLKKPENFDKQISEFFTTCRNVNTELNKLENDVLSNKISLLTVNDGEAESEGIFGSIDNKLLEYPSVIFDGPFSDGQERTTPKTKRDEVSREQAEEYVKKLGFDVGFKEEVKGIISAYVFENESLNIQVTKEGGLLLLALSDREIKEAVLSENEAIEKAEKFAQKLNFGNIKMVWQEFYGNYGIFNFASVIDDRVVYPDLFKIKVALDNGDVLAFEGKSYIMNNREREVEKPKISIEEARGKLKEGFLVEASKKCIISVNERELECYEFFGSYNDLEFAVYISASSGEEMTSFRIISTETGKMTA